MITKQDLQNKIEASRVSKLLEKMKYENLSGKIDTGIIVRDLEERIRRIRVEIARGDLYVYITDKGNIAEQSQVTNPYSYLTSFEDIGNRLEGVRVIEFLEGIIRNIKDKDLNDARYFLNQSAKRILREGGYVYLTSEGLMPESAIKECIQVIDECCSHLE